MTGGTLLCAAIIITVIEGIFSIAKIRKAWAYRKQRFLEQARGEFSSDFNNNIRSIFIIKDNQTKKEYLAITGCGTTELNSEYDDNLKITVTEEE